MKKLTQISLVLGLVCLLSVLGLAQTAPTYTTLAAAVTGGGNTPGSGLGTQAIQTTIFVASTTNINGFGAGVSGPQGFNPNNAVQYNTYLLVDRELMAVQTVNTSTKAVTVLRGWQGTAINPHNNGAVVIAGLPAQFSPIDPTGACTAATTLVSPVIVVGGSAPPVGNFGRQWICDAVTGDWLPILTTGTITPAACSATVGTISAQTFTLNGTVTGEPISLMVQPTPTSCVVVGYRITATNTITIYFAPLIASATPASGVYMFFDTLHY